MVAGSSSVHLIDMPGGEWALWRSMVLRGTGFEARRLLDLAAPEVDALVSRLLDLEDEKAALRRELVTSVNTALDELRNRGQWDDKEQRRPLMKALRVLTKGKLPKAVDWSGEPGLLETLARLHADLELAQRDLKQLYVVGQGEVSRELQTVARDKHFREAVTWQNRNAVHTALDELAGLADPANERRSKQRQHEELVANYLQRYCSKNDTIGFFGPVGWARFTDDDEAVRMRPGRELLERREVYFENWCINTLAKQAAAQTELRPWLVPRLKSCHQRIDNTLHRPFGPPMKLTGAAVRLLTALDGERCARAVADKLIADPAFPSSSLQQIYKQLDILVEKRLLTWGLEIPLELHPEQTLDRLLSKIEPERLHSEAVAPLREIEEARRSVAAAAGDPSVLDASLAALEETFARLTGEPARRHHGQTYAGRGLVYEDCRRQAEVSFGTDFLQYMGPPLGQVLDGARWLIGEMYEQFAACLEKEYLQLAEGREGRVIESSTLYSRVLSRVFLTRERSTLLVRSEEAYQRRWSKVLGLTEEVCETSRLRLTTADLCQKISEEFGDPGPTWSLARHVSPDMMIAAGSAEDIGRGEMDFVLGEIHLSNTILSSCFVSQHPAPEEVFSNLERDVTEEPIVVPQVIREGWNQRVNPVLSVSSFYRYDLADTPPGSAVDCCSLPAANVVVEMTEVGLEARTRDGALRFPAIELFGRHLNGECTDMISHFLPPARHWPRISIDHVVISRERWRFSAQELEFARMKDPMDRFMATRRWAHENRLPRFCFYKVTTEPKPCYLDLASPIFVDIFAKLLRKTMTSEDNSVVSISEMLPRGDQSWLEDAEGRHYTSELRMVAINQGEGFRYGS